VRSVVVVYRLCPANSSCAFVASAKVRFINALNNNNDNNNAVATAGTSEDAGTIMAATWSAATVDDTPLDAAARFSIMHILELRQSERLTLSQKIRLHSTVLHIPQRCELPVQETTKQKYYL